MNIIRIRIFKLIAAIIFGIVIIVLGFKWMKSHIGGHSHHHHHHHHHDHQHQPPTNTAKLTMDDVSPNWKFRPQFLSDNTTNKLNQTARAKIPQIIHQVWDTDEIPSRYEKWVKTWKALHPHWQYWFWTLDDVRQLVSRHYPSHLVLYDSYTAPIFRADVMRYFVLHRYGGIYLDLDMDALKPLDDWTVHYDCLVSEEPYEHAFIIREQAEINILNGFIACRAGHPFLKLAIDHLEEYAGRNFGDYLHATGPYFFNAVHEKFVKSKSKDEVTVLPPFYFFPTYDNSESDTIAGKCYPAKIQLLPAKGQAVCRHVMMASFKNDPTELAFTDHHWVHAYMFDDNWKKTDTMTIDKAVDGVVRAKDKL